MTDRRSCTVIAGLALALLHTGVAEASSHREAPLIAEDPTADATDLYAWVDGASQSDVNIIANYWPLEEPGGGPNFPRLSDNVLYEIKIDNTGDAVADITYQFRFKTTFTSGTTSFLYNNGVIASPTDAHLLVQQTYTVTRIDSTGTTTSGPFPTAPLFVGKGSYGAANEPAAITAYNLVAAQAKKTLTTTGDGFVFVGPRDDPFFVDLGDVFDLVTIRGTPGTGIGGVDFVAGYNVHTIAIQVPITGLQASGGAGVIGVWTTSSRKRVQVMRPGALQTVGAWQQISRLGVPLVNEVVVPVGVKDFYNTTTPTTDATGPAYAVPLITDPELTKLFAALYAGLGPYPVGGTPSSTDHRTDLVKLLSFNFADGPGGTGLPTFHATGLTPADILRLDLTVTDASPTGNVNLDNRLSIINGEMGFPNGRRPKDDVVDIEEQVFAGGLCSYTVTLAASCGAAGTNFPSAINVAKFGDNVNGNDVAYMGVFPYMPPPWSGSVGSAIHKQY